MDLPLDRYVNLVEYWAMRHAKDADELRITLHTPPQEVRRNDTKEVGGVWSREAEMAAFRQLGTAKG